MVSPTSMIEDITLSEGPAKEEKSFDQLKAEFSDMETRLPRSWQLKEQFSAAPRGSLGEEVATSVQEAAPSRPLVEELGPVSDGAARGSLGQEEADEESEMIKERKGDEYLTSEQEKQKEIEQKIWELAANAGSTLDRNETGGLNSELMRTLRSKYQGMGP
ncbi:uncharacterized protein LOC115927438 [Strongylocentrotus purpuratus]|uniref:Uncharacterized protein n=1 Tax=Strongylocentrotus purpuratus TaxID=7668 RepID=A0A7M7T2J0_STRPU|nr:uncharacterized protein LOC115927438 [Strongylocentrotus purpuratus]